MKVSPAWYLGAMGCTCAWSHMIVTESVLWATLWAVHRSVFLSMWLMCWENYFSHCNDLTKSVKIAVYGCVCVCVLILQFEPLVFNSNNGTSSLPLTDGDISPWKWNHLLRVPQLISCWDVAPLEPTVLPDDDCGVCSIETYCVKGLKKPCLFYFNLWISVILKSLFRKHGIYLSTETVFNI